MKARLRRLALSAALTALGSTLAIVITASPASAAAWSAWGSLGNTGMTGPSSAGRANGNLDVVAAKGNAIYHKWWSASSGWSGWKSIGSPCPSGSVPSDPSATARRTGELDIFVSCADPGLVNVVNGHVEFVIGGQVISALAVSGSPRSRTQSSVATDTRFPRGRTRNLG